jgi:Na+/melibiose symporter-like transporter
MSASVENTPTVGSGNSNPSGGAQKLSFAEKAGYSCADSAANFVFMTMVLFQLNFYTDVFGLSATAAAMILLWPRLWDAAVDPIVGILADRTSTRWGKFRPWILFTTVPWVIVMVLAYTTPHGWSYASMVAYACITNMLLMTIYSMNNMPYAALGGVMTGDINERAKLNSFRFVAVNAAQFIVGGFTLPLVAKFAAQHAGTAAVGATDKQYGWTVTMSIWAALCFVLFLITFATTKERIKPTSHQKSSPGEDFRALLKNNPWKVMWLWTLVHFAILSFRGGALYNYYHHYADKPAMFEAVKKFGLVVPAGAHGNGLLEWLGYIVHGDASAGNVADVFNSIVNMMGTALIMITILLSPSLAKNFGKKAVSTAGFVLATIGTFVFYMLSPTNVWGMLAVTAIISIVYAPTIPLTWAIFADVADYSEWKTNRRFTGMVFATIGFALKSGLALGSAGFLWIMGGMFLYDSHGSPRFEAGDVNRVPSISNVSALAKDLNAPNNPVAVYVKGQLSPGTVADLSVDGKRDVAPMLITDLNKLLSDKSFYEPNRFTGVKLKEYTTDLIAKKDRSEYDTECLNRSLLEAAFPDAISDTHNQTAESIHGFRVTSGLVVGILFAICSVLLGCYQLNKHTTLQMAGELEERRRKMA